MEGSYFKVIEQFIFGLGVLGGRNIEHNRIPMFGNNFQTNFDRIRINLLWSKSICCALDDRLDAIPNLILGKSISTGYRLEDIPNLTVLVLFYNFFCEFHVINS